MAPAKAQHRSQGNGGARYAFNVKGVRTTWRVVRQAPWKPPVINAWGCGTRDSRRAVDGRTKPTTCHDVLGFTVTWWFHRSVSLRTWTSVQTRHLRERHKVVTVGMFNGATNHANGLTYHASWVVTHKCHRVKDYATANDRMHMEAPDAKPKGVAA